MDYIELPEVCPNDVLEISEDNTLKITDYEYDLALAKCEVYNEAIGTWNSALGFLYLSLGTASARKCELMTLNADVVVLEYPLSEDIAPNYELNVTKIRLVLERIK
ncbi:hypothetical protein [Flavobacterium sp. NKUCC04_CG]|uniref:hypothetical protein n=1 Tax=Flavobacterium sp. NKUCC04_CG TaxID=2842121 RepID=UPI001C5BA97B|nr:hypothetical protein [Flavobacterium sp. NKUCC04_CG]MBW3519752.1 hypothetical protein [Flavobacterium sp. NKUCC04_CG]